jgi:REP element-mobilizing transposase RayT
VKDGANLKWTGHRRVATEKTCSTSKPYARVVATALRAVLLAVKDGAVADRPQAGGYRENLLDEQNALAIPFNVKRELAHRPLRLNRLFHSRPLYFVTFCTYRRRKWLARDDVHQAFVDFAVNAHRKFNFAVGRYVIMPEHVHLFVCGDAAFVLGRWVGQLKQALARGAGLTRQSSQVWQEGCFDHVLRGDESYGQKWQYVCDNPVRAGLVASADEWPYQGEIVYIDRA